MSRDRRTGILLVAVAAALLALEAGAVSLAAPRARGLLAGTPVVTVARAGVTVARGLAREALAGFVPGGHASFSSRCTRG